MKTAVCHKIVALATFGLYANNVVLADNFHMKVKVEPNPPKVNELSAMALSLYNFQRMEVMDWDEMKDGADQDEYKDSLVAAWVIGSDFNEVAYYEFPYDHPFDDMQNKFNMPHVFHGNGRYLVAARLKLPEGSHSGDIVLDQAAVIKTTVGGYDYKQAYEIAQFDTKFRSPMSMVHYSKKHYFDRIPEPSVRHKRFISRKIAPIAPRLYDEDAPDNEYHDISQEHDGVTFTVYSHAAPDPEPYVDDEGVIIRPFLDEAGEDEMYMLKTVYVKQVLFNETLNGTVTDEMIKEHHAKGESAYKSSFKTCRTIKDDPALQDLSSCGMVNIQLSDCRVCVPGDEGEEEICAADTSCNSKVKVKFVDFLMTMGATMVQGGGNWVMRYRGNTTASSDDHVAGVFPVPTVIERFDNGTEFHRIHGTNESICSEETSYTAFDNGTISLQHKFMEDGFYNAVIRYVLEDGSVLYSTHGFVVPEIPRWSKLPFCDGEENESEEDFVDEVQGKFEDLQGAVGANDSTMVLIKSVVGGFAVVFVIAMLGLLILKPGSGVEKAKTD